MTTNSATAKTKNPTQMLVVNSLLIALTLVATMFINIRIPFMMGSGGLIHLGNVPLFVAAMVYGKKSGALAGAFGMSLFDLISGWTAWAPFTFLIVGTMGYAIGLITEKKPFKNQGATNVLAIAVAVLLKIVGYYFAEVLLYGNWLLPLGSIPGNVIQVAFAGILVLPFIERLKKLA